MRCGHRYGAGLIRESVTAGNVHGLSGIVHTGDAEGGNVVIGYTHLCSLDSRNGKRFALAQRTGKNGVAVIPCIYCGKELETEVIPMLGDIRNPVIPNTDAVA